MNQATPPSPDDPSSTLLDALRRVVGATAVFAGEAIPAGNRTDWSGATPTLPLALTLPADTAQVQAIMRVAHAHRVPVVPQGGMTGLAGAGVPLPNALALSLAKMSRIEGLDPQAGTLTVQAGLTLQAAQEAAAEAGWQLGLDLGARGSCQIGGNLATNAGGNNVVQFGMAREQVLGLEVVLADGTLLPMMRPMQKNNTGYDLKHWFIGSEGTLGIITRAILQLRPAASARATAMVALPDYESAKNLLAQMRGTFPGALNAFELMWADFYDIALAWRGRASPFPNATPFAALIDVTGANEAALRDALESAIGVVLDQGVATDAVLAQSIAQARELWALREITGEFSARIQAINFDVSLPLPSLGPAADECAAAILARWPGATILRFGHLGDNNLHLTVDARSLPNGMDDTPALEEVFYAVIGRAGGSVSAEHGIGTHKKPFLHLSRSEAELAAMRAIKAALDPLNLLNPGRVF